VQAQFLLYLLCKTAEHIIKPYSPPGGSTYWWTGSPTWTVFEYYNQSEGQFKVTACHIANN